jgi:uncharacterized protein YjbI with pentapeptide repeats
MATNQSGNKQLGQLLVDGDINAFNQARKQIAEYSLAGLDLSSIDLRNLNAMGLDMRDCHLGHADLRGIDFSGTNMQGASISCAKISGTLFPQNLRAEEITLSLVHGTRMRAERE